MIWLPWLSLARWVETFPFLSLHEMDLQSVSWCSFVLPHHTHTTHTHPHTHTTHTHTHTHTAGSDYTTTSQTLTFTPTTDSRSGTVGILDDDSVELEENFEGFLFVDTPIDRLTITPTVATVTIGDTDSEYTLCVCVRLLHQLFQ